MSLLSSFIRSHTARPGFPLKLVALWAMAVIGLSKTASATIVIDDTFTGANNTALLGRLSSPTDQPGNPYAGNGNVTSLGGPTGGTPYEADIQSNKARVG